MNLHCVLYNVHIYLKVVSIFPVKSLIDAYTIYKFSGSIAGTSNSIEM